MWRTTETAPLRMIFCTGLVLGLLVISMSPLIPFLHDSKQNKAIVTEHRIGCLKSADPDAFISVWDTTKVSIESSNSDQVKLPLESDGTYDFLVDWGDGSNDTIAIWNQTESTHTYSTNRINTIQITGIIEGWRFNHGGDRNKIIEIQQWGCLRLGNNGNYFDGCENLVYNAYDNLNLTGTTNLRKAFAYCWRLGTSGNINGWDVSRVTDMSNMFFNAWLFNQPLGNWNVSKVTDMSYMFYRTEWFNTPIGNWNVSSVTDMSHMFYDADSFNQSLGNWNVSSVIDMNYMFASTNLFNQPLGNWNVSRVTDMSYMFAYTRLFNQPIGNWNVSRVTDMSYMFTYTRLFNQPIGNWNVSSVTDMSHMFNDADAFNQPLGNWNVSRVTDMSNMFNDADAFNQPLGNWNVSSVTNMIEMFSYITLSTENYDNLLQGWSQLQLETGVQFDGGFSTYSRKGERARNILINSFEWTINDGGPAYRTLQITIPIVSIVVFVGGGVIAVSIIIKNKGRKNKFDQISLVESENINHYSTFEHGNYQHIDHHSDVNLLYFEKFENLKKSLTAENYDDVRKQLIMLLEQINQDPQAEFIEKKLHTYISDLLQEIAERFDES